jgi:sulfur-oxidizing protein SoxY
MRWMIVALAACMAAGAQAAPPADRLGSPNWAPLAQTVFGDAAVRFDDRVQVRFPGIVEDQHAFPVEVDARGLQGVQRILILADLNPIPLVLDYKPDHAQPFVATRIKIDQRTPVRGAVQLADGSWLVSGGWVDAAGGGCSAPPVSRVKGDWAEHLGEVRGAAVADGDGARVRVAIRHPMDTGFVANIPTYYLEDLTLTGAGGESLGTLELSAAVSEDPALTVLVAAKAGDELAVAGRDTNGIEVRARLTVAPALMAAK